MPRRCAPRNDEGCRGGHWPSASGQTYGNADAVSFTYDILGRAKTTTYSDGRVLTYTYTGDGQLYRITDSKTGYTYDELGNIATYTENGVTYEYTYDVQNQLTQQTGGGITYTYTYDGVGNILTATDGTTSHSYTYGDAVWKDLLTAFDGESITYDGSGNPTSYYNGTRWTFDWEEGRRLVSASGDGKALTFTYDSDGLRLTKTVDDTTYNYFYAGGKLIRQTWGDNTLDFFYDESGHPYAVTHSIGESSTTYYYVTNLQSDVLAILDSSKQVVASYTYDPYGKVLTATGTLAEVNPLRYRGYVYDSETGFYYLQSRYYDPTICRFINADALASTGQGIIGHNMFAYCGNNPICQTDYAGNMAGSAAVAATNFWNPAGWIAAAIFVVEVIAVIVIVEEIDDIVEDIPAYFESEHTKNKRPSTRETHQKGQTRKQNDQGGEKKDRHKGWRPNPNKRRGRFLIYEIFMEEMY